MREVVYMAHQLGGDITGNIECAKAWLRWLRKAEPGTTFIAPWIAAILSGADDDSPAEREHGLRDAEAVVGRCDGIVLCGPRISDGMAREVRAIERKRMRNAILDLTGSEMSMPPDDPGFLRLRGTQVDSEMRATLAQWCRP